MNGKETGTVFTSASTNHNSNPNGAVVPTMMSAAGQKLASVSAPGNSYEIHTKSTAAVKE